MRLGITNDHRGYKLKVELLEKLKKDYEVIDYGAKGTENVDYPLYAFKLGKALTNKEIDFGIAICGSGIGISIACNKVKGARAARVWKVLNCCRISSRMPESWKNVFRMKNW